MGWLMRNHGMTIDCAGRGRDRDRGRAAVDGEPSGTCRPVLGDPRRGRQLRGRDGFGYQLDPVETVLGGAIVLPPTAEGLRASSRRRGGPTRALDDHVRPEGGAAPPVPGRRAPPSGGHVMFVLTAIPKPGKGSSTRAARGRPRWASSPARCRIWPSTSSPPRARAGRGDHAQGLARRARRRGDRDVLREWPRPPPRRRLRAVRVLGGAIADVPVAATAFPHRDKTVMPSMQAAHGEDRAAADTWTERSSRPSPRKREAPTRASWRTRAMTGSVTPTRPARTRDWPRSSAATTRQPVPP